MLKVDRYDPSRADQWNRFVATSRNGTFLFDRRYMDYHKNRFEDLSLVISKDDRIVALLPANRGAGASRRCVRAYGLQDGSRDLPPHPRRG